MQHQTRFPLLPVLALLGTGLLFAGTLLHPMHADPNMAAEAFTEYAADRHWVTSHLLQLAGIWAMTGALVLLARRLEEGAARSWARLGMAFAIAGMATAAALQAVDGVALKAMVDRWAAASEPEKTALFAAAFGVRQIEIGLASMNSLLLGGMAAIVGVAITIDGRLPAWTGFIGIAGGIATATSGVVIAETGFSGAAMAIGMPANLALMAWLIAIAVLSWKRAFY